MNIRYPLAAILLLASATNIHASPLRIHDRGMEGDTRYYNTTCPDGTVGSVTRRFNVSITRTEGSPADEIKAPPARRRTSTTTAKGQPLKVVEVCMTNPKSRERVCRADWDLDAAARASCR